MSVPKLRQAIARFKSFLCVGLDIDLNRLPRGISASKEDLIFFNKTIIDSTLAHCAAYKLNLAFYEALGSIGYELMEQTLKHIPNTHFTIADAKRGDIGNTATKYAEAVFKHLDFDAITIAPYMGRDSVLPFLEYKDKTVILLALTSNVGSSDFQLKRLDNQKYVFECVLEEASKWAGPDQLMFVVGATHPEYFDIVRTYAPDHFLLVPGVGHQGGSLEDVCNKGITNDIGLLINSSRAIIYAGDGLDYGEAAARAAANVQQQMLNWL